MIEIRIIAKKKNNGLNNCAWCFRPTSLPAVFAPSTPLIEWIEEKINIVANHKQIKRSDIWGEHSDWGKLGLGQKFEIELLAYDDLLNSVSRKHICKSCLVEDHKLWLKYYSQIDDDPNDIDVILDIE